jgi:RNAse (barnase) inhibitor barstar
MTTLTLDATAWSSSDDVYDAFFRAVGAPAWHGRNFDALRDSIETGSINAVEVPYEIVVRNSAVVGAGAKQMLDDFADLIRDLATGGCPVSIRLE